ncbi:transposase [Streptomyces actuosus]|uniref:Transposase n=1 Tax=Streptomyces actuosus TaxID=1885 RepID=A0ABS2VN12_STRAS|nr:transposase [Streptomyces actuosus]
MTLAQLTDEEWEFIEPHLPIGEHGPYPRTLRQQFEGVIWRFRTGGQRREMPSEFGASSTVSHRFRQWRDAGVSEALPEDLSGGGEAGRGGPVPGRYLLHHRAHHDAAGMHLGGRSSPVGDG